MPSARWWKSFYAAERAALGEAGLELMIDLAPRLDLPTDGALVFPHARLGGCGTQIAAVASAVARSGRERVLALGVLHGAREQDAELVRAARGGDQQARARLRRTHRDEDEHASEEFSLDHLRALVAVAARMSGVAAPAVVGRYPFLVGDSVDDLPGLDDLRAELADGAALVATADLIHHGAGYGTPTAERLPLDPPSTLQSARDLISTSLALLLSGEQAAFQRHCTAVRSDFRDNGPVLHALIGERATRARIHDLCLIDYASTLGADAPTWVAGALVEIGD